MLQCVFAKPDMEISVVNDSMEDILGKKKQKKNKSTGKCLLHMYSGYVHTHKNNVMQRGANTPHSSPLVACSLLFFFYTKYKNPSATIFQLTLVQKVLHHTHI